MPPEPAALGRTCSCRAAVIKREEHFRADLDRSAYGGRAENAACSVQDAAGRMRHERLSVAARARLRSPAETTRHDNRCRSPTSVGAVVRPRGRVPALVRTAWARPGAAADWPNSIHRALQISRAARLSHKSTATVKYAMTALAGAPQAKPRLNARRGHVRPPPTADADVTQQAAGRQEVPKLQGAARPTGTHCMCRANGHALHATGQHAGSDARGGRHHEPYPT